MRTAGMGKKNGDDERLMRVRFCCQIMNLGECLNASDRSATLEKHFASGAFHFKIALFYERFA
jgi:hypothetical protein